MARPEKEKTVGLDSALHKAAKLAAVERGISMKKLAAEAIRRELERNRRKS